MAGAKGDLDGLRRSAPYASVGEIDVDEISLWEETTAPWELMARPLDRRLRFGNHKTYLVTPSVVLYRESFDTGLRIRGLTPARMLTLSVPLRTGSRTAYWKAPPAANELPTVLPGGLDVVLDNGHDHLILLVSLDLLERVLPEDGMSRLLAAAAARTLTDTPANIDRFGKWQLWVLAQAMRQPDAFRHQAVVHAFEQDLLGRLAAIGEPGATAQPRGAGSLRRRGLERALEYLRATDPAYVKVSDLCRVAGVSERTLEYGFREAVGVPPLSFIHHRRLHAARRELLANQADSRSVTDVAHGLGFLELGRFAAQYRHLFGELPSQSLARPLRGQRCTPLVFP